MPSPHTLSHSYPGDPLHNLRYAICVMLYKKLTKCLCRVLFSTILLAGCSIKSELLAPYLTKLFGKLWWMDFNDTLRKGHYLYKGVSINYVDKQGGERGEGSPKCQRYYINLFSELVNEGERGVKNSQNFVNVVYGCPLELNHAICWGFTMIWHQVIIIMHFQFSGYKNTL